MLIDVRDGVPTLTITVQELGSFLLDESGCIAPEDVQPLLEALGDRVKAHAGCDSDGHGAWRDQADTFLIEDNVSAE